MNSRRLSFKAFFIILIACVLFIPSSSTEITEPIRDGDYIYIDDSKAYLKGTYSTTHDQTIEHWAMTKQFTGDCDMAIGFDGEVAWPTKVLLEDPHYVYWDTDTPKTFYYVSNFAPTTDTQDYGNWYNPLKYIFDHKIFIGYDNITNESIWQDVVGTVAYFDSQENDGINYTITWHTEHSRLEQYRDISDRILANPIEYEFDNKNIWFITKNIPIISNEMRKIVIEMDGMIRLGEQSYKYDIIWKPSSQTIAEARAAGNLYILDPYWNTSFSTRKPITITTAGTSTPAHYQVLLNITHESEMQANFNDTRFTNSTHVEISYWIESKVDGSYALIWVNLSDAITDPESDMIWMYYGNDGLSDGGDGNDTFVFFDDFDDGVKTGWTSVGGTWSEANSMMSRTDQNAQAVIRRTSDTISDGIIRIKHRQTVNDSNSNPSGGIVARGTGASQGSGYQFAINDILTGNKIQISNVNDWNEIAVTSKTIDLNTWYIIEAIMSGSTLKVKCDDTEASGSDAAYSSGAFGLRYYEAKGDTDWYLIRKYIANEPTPSYDTAQHYADSLHYNSTLPYNFTIESDGTLTSNRSIIAADDTNWTANSTGTTYWQHTTAVTPTGYSNFTISSDTLDNFTATNLTASTYYDLKNSSGIVESQTTDGDGIATFEVDLVGGDYWVGSAVGAPTVTLLSMTPSTICQNCTGNISIEYGISHSSAGLNNTSVSFIYRDYDYDLDDSNHSIRPPANNLASEWNFDGRILRGANRNETANPLNFEYNDTITGGDPYTWSGLDENSSEINIVPINSTYTKVYINSTIHRVMPQMHYIDRTDIQEAPKTTIAIHKHQDVLVKFWNFEIFKGNTDFVGVGYTDAVLDSNPALWPLDANPVNYYYISSGYDPATGGDPLTSGYAVYMGSLNASGWTNHVHSPHANSSYVRGFINNTLLETYINTTNISYVLYTSNTPQNKAFFINVTNVATSSNVSFANTGVLWAGDNAMSAEPYTPNIWFAFMKLNMSLDHKLYVTDNNNNWANSTMNRTNITTGLFPPTKPSFYAFHNGFQDFDMNGTYHDTIQIQVGASSDPDGGIVTHNITLHYGANNTYVATINGSAVAEDGVYTNISFNTTPYYSQTENYTLRVVATDDEGETATTWLGVNFSLDGSPRIISYSPSTPVTSIRGDTQTFSITTNLLGNVTWYLDSVEVFNETSVNYSSYSNSTAPIGTYNVTVTTTNINGTNSMTWDWEVEDPILAALLQLQSDINDMKKVFVER